MKIPFLDLKRINTALQADIERAVRSVIESGWYILGNAVETFETNCKTALIGAREGHVTGCNSGTDALVLSLLAAGVGPGDEVITVSHTAIPTVSAINAVGARPIFVDIDARTWVMDVTGIPAAITPRTKAVIPVHLYGNMADMAALHQTIARAHADQLCIIEDVAQAQGSFLAGRQAGTFGRFGAFSFYPSKNIGALGDGGAVFCPSSTDMQLLRSLRNYGQQDRNHAEIPRGINSRLDEIQAAIVDVKLRFLPEWNRTKSHLMDRYRRELNGLPLKFQEITHGCEPAWHLCVIAVEDRKTRDALISHLNNAEIQALIHYPIPNHRQRAFSRTASGTLPVTDDLSGRILSLPFNTVITEDEIEYLMKQIRSFFR